MKTSDLIGPALDWAVGKADNCDLAPVEYSSKWEFGGPIIERERIDLETQWNIMGCGCRESLKEWCAIHPKNYGGLIRYYGYGPTPLIAAMRCYCCAKLGDEIDIPRELQLCQQPNL